jgi:glycosyltransferase involved in cell wall biosynthesis
MTGLRVVFVHTSFALYWPARLAALQRLLTRHGCELHAIEVTADPGPYSFAGKGAGNSDGNGNGNGDLTPVSVPGPRTVQLFGRSDLATLAPSVVSARLWAELDVLAPDVVVSGAIAFTPGATAVRWCRARRRGIVVMDDARLADVPRSRLVNAVKRRFYANVDAMLVPAPTHRESCEFFGIPASQIFFGVDVVDNDFFATRAASARQSLDHRTLVNGQPRRPCFLGVGRQVPKKNWCFLLDAYARYRALAGHDDACWDLMLIGDGPDRERIAARARELGLSSSLRLLGSMPPREMPSGYAMADCLVLPSFYGETWGLVVNEAMACGLPVLVSDECGCAGALVEPGRNGWTFSPRDVDALAALLQRMARLPDAQRCALGSRSRAIIADWSLDRFASGAWEAIQACAPMRRGFQFPLDRFLLPLWKGRFRPT